MAKTLTELKTARDDLQANLDSGVDNLSEGDKKVAFRPAGDIANRIAALNRQIAEIEDAVTTRGIYPQLTKGWQ